nr:hypothetical protein [uncultured Actinoplanes sp.]
MTQIQPADFETADYRTVLRRLTTLDDEAAAMRAEAVRWHDSRVAAADEAVREADQAVRAAAKAAADAQREYERVEAGVDHLWSEYVHKVPAAERYGKRPPEATIPRQRGGRDAADYLEEIAARIQHTEKARSLNAGVKFLFALLGLFGGVAGAAANQALRQAGASASTGTWKDALPVVALLALLACPVLAVVATKRVADRRGVGLDAATVAMVLVTGLVTAGVLVAALRSAG